MCKFCTHLWTTIENMFLLMNNNTDSSYSCVLDFCQILVQTFSAYFIFIKLSSINYDRGATFARKQSAGLTRGSSDWSTNSGKLWRVDVRVSRSPRAHSNSALAAIFTTITWTCYYEHYLSIGQWDSLLSDLRLEWFFETQTIFIISS